MADQCDLFEKIRIEVAAWVERSNYTLGNDVKISVLADTTDSYVANFDFQSCMAELVVSHPDFAPYRFVSFMIAALVEGRPTFVYTWYDKDGDDMETILEKLDEGICFAAKYEE